MALQVSQSNPNLHAAAVLLAQTAKQAGVPQDSLSRFLQAGYVPQPKQLIFHATARECDAPDGPTRVGLGGARGGTKSHTVLAQVGLDDCQRFDGLKFLYLRKVLKAAKESFDDLRRRVLMGVPHDYRRQEGVVRFKNDSRIILGHYQNEKDIDAYLGLEYDGVAIEEATQLSHDKVKDIRTCVRTSKLGWRPREYYTTNPGGIGHQWFKQEFIDPFRQDRETVTRFIPTTHKDNAFLDSGYVSQLNQLTGWKLRAWRDGDWDIAAGQFFSTWRHDAIVRDDLRIMPGSNVWGSLDYGFQHPTVSHLFAEYDGKIQIVDEHWMRHGLVSENAASIKAMLDRHNVTVPMLSMFVAGPDVFAQRGNASGKTIADEYRECGIVLTAANTDRVNGAARLLRLLGSADSKPPIQPQIEISSRCPRLIECIPAMQHDPHRPEDVLKVDIDDDGMGGDDPYDSARYGIASDRRDRYSESENQSWSRRTY